MGFDFFGCDVDLKICLQQGVELSPGRYTKLDSQGKPLPGAEDPDVVRVGLRTGFLQTAPGGSEIILTRSVEGDKVEQPLDFFRSMMTKMEMEIGLSLVPKASITIDPPSNDLALAMLNSNVFAFGNILALRFGYTRSPFEQFPGNGKDSELFMLMKPEVAFGEAISFTLRGLGGLATAQRTTATITYKSQSPEEIVDTIAVRNGLKLVPPTFLTPEPESVSPLVPDLTISPASAPGELEWRTKGDWEQTQQSDWDFLNRVLESIPGKMTFRVEGDRLIINPLSTQLAAQPKAIFKWYHAPKFNASTGQPGGSLQVADELPILKFGSDTNFAFFPASSAGIALNMGFGRDQVNQSGNNKAAVPGQDLNTQDKNQSVPQTGSTTNSSTKLGDNPDIVCGNQRAKPFGAFKGKQAAQQITQSSSADQVNPRVTTSTQNFEQEAQFFGNWQVDIETIGVPTLRPGDLILVKGFETVGTVTEKLNGLFLVKKLVHTIGSDGFTTAITAMRNATPGEGVPVGGTQNLKTTPQQVQPRATNTKTPIPAKDKP